MVAAASLESLPRELLEMIFSLLSPQGLKSSVLVSRRWRVVGEQGQALWVWVWIKVTSRNMGQVPEILNTRRMQGVFVLEVEPPAFGQRTPKIPFQDLIRALFNHTGKLVLCLKNNDLSR